MKWGKWAGGPEEALQDFAELERALAAERSAREKAERERDDWKGYAEGRVSGDSIAVRLDHELLLARRELVEQRARAADEAEGAAESYASALAYAQEEAGEAVARAEAAESRAAKLAEHSGRLINDLNDERRKLAAAESRCRELEASRDEAWVEANEAARRVRRSALLQREAEARVRELEQERPKVALDLHEQRSGRRDWTVADSSDPDSPVIVSMATWRELEASVQRLREACGRVVALDAQDYTPQEAAAAFEEAVHVAREALSASGVSPGDS